MNRTTSIQTKGPDVSKYIEFIAALDTGKAQCDCKGNPVLSAKDVDMYDHSGGIFTPFGNNKQWVYVNCRRCGYNWSWWKIVRRVSRL